jgi:hypothetical protein
MEANLCCAALPGLDDIVSLGSDLVIEAIGKGSESSQFARLRRLEVGKK